jgi:hypothetical protein
MNAQNQIGETMRRSFLKRTVLTACSIIALGSFCFAQSSEIKPKLGVGAKVSSLGYGFEAATAVTHNSNVRGGFNMFRHDEGLSRDGINFGTELRLRSAEAHYDWFVGHGFRLSPGLLLYNGNRIEGVATVPGSRQFTIGGNTYYSSPSDPVNGPFKVDLGKSKVAPMLTAGFGNLLRRSGRRFSVTVEGGVVFQGSPNAHLDLGGSVGPTPAGPFFSVQSNAQVQADLRAEENKINTGASPYEDAHTIVKYYPVISLGFGFRIK